jgi:steroid Delta-isomerase
MEITIMQQARHIYDEWNEGFHTKDLDRVMALYAEDAVIETPAVLANYPDAPDGILRSREKIRALFAKNLQVLSTTFQGLYRPVQFFSDGKYLTWEYPCATPSGGAQVDLFESMDIENGLIAYHRVYWGWSGFQKLMKILEAERAR